MSVQHGWHSRFSELRQPTVHTTPQPSGSDISLLVGAILARVVTRWLLLWCAAPFGKWRQQSPVIAAKRRCSEQAEEYWGYVAPLTAWWQQSRILAVARRSVEDGIEYWEQRQLCKGRSTSHGSGMRCGLGNLFVISELNSAIIFLSLKNMIALFSSEMTNRFPSPHLIPRP